MRFHKDMKMKNVFLFTFLIVLSCTPYPARSTSKPDFTNNPDIIIVDVMDKDIANYGRWPWPRDIHGKALDVLNSQGALGVYFDFVFSEDAVWKVKD